MLLTHLPQLSQGAKSLVNAPFSRPFAVRKIIRKVAPKRDRFGMRIR